MIRFLRAGVFVVGSLILVSCGRQEGDQNASLMRLLDSDTGTISPPQESGSGPEGGVIPPPNGDGTSSGTQEEATSGGVPADSSSGSTATSETTLGSPSPTPETTAGGSQDTTGATSSGGDTSSGGSTSTTGGDSGTIPSGGGSTGADQGSTSGGTGTTSGSGETGTGTSGGSTEGSTSGSIGGASGDPSSSGGSTSGGSTGSSTDGSSEATPTPTPIAGNDGGGISTGGGSTDSGTGTSGGSGDSTTDSSGSAGSEGTPAGGSSGSGAETSGGSGNGTETAAGSGSGTGTSAGSDSAGGDENGGNEGGQSVVDDDQPGCPVALEPIEGSLYALDRSVQQALSATGNAEAVARGAIIVDSTDERAMFLVGNAIVRAPDVSIAGNYILHGNASLLAGNIRTRQRAFGDPLRFLPPPESSSLPVRSTVAVHLSKGSHHLQPGVYRGGISVSGKASVNLAPGIYLMDGGGFSFTGQGSLEGREVMIYNDPQGTSQGIRLAGQKGDVTLTAPVSGRYRGIAIYQNRLANVGVDITGDGSLHLEGAVYAAGAEVKIAGNGDEIASLHVSRRLVVHGNGSINIGANQTAMGCPK